MILVNGYENKQFSALDRGLHYGDGVFRTLLAKAGKAMHWAQHYAKLQADCARLFLGCPPAETLLADIAHVLEATSDCVLKIIITRGENQRGYAALSSPTVNRIVLSSDLPNYPVHYAREGIAMHVCELRLGHQPKLAGIKHLNRLENVLARMEWADPNIMEGLLCDEAGWAIEGVMSNLFFYRDGILHTPDLSQCGVAGVQRERILQGRAAVRVGYYTLADILAADEVFVTNSLIGIWPVRQLLGRTWQHFDATFALTL